MNNLRYFFKIKSKKSIKVERGYVQFSHMLPMHLQVANKCDLKIESLQYMFNGAYI